MTTAVEILRSTITSALPVSLGRLSTLPSLPTMVGSDGKVLNRPSDTGSAEVIVERKISTAVVISEVN